MAYQGCYLLGNERSVSGMVEMGRRPSMMVPDCNDICRRFTYAGIHVVLGDYDTYEVIWTDLNNYGSCT